MLRLNHLEELARVTRNFAQLATTEDERDELLTMAAEYERRAQLRRDALEFREVSAD